MKNIFNNLIISTIELLPRSFIKIFAYKYVAGEIAENAITVVKDLNKKGFAVTLDILGEHVSNKNTAEEICNEYQKLLIEIKQNDLDCNLSIKPSHLGMDINFDCAKKNIMDIIEKANEYNNFIRIDMEDSTQTDLTIKLYNELKRNHDNVVIVHQAYLHRSEKDIKNNSKMKNFNFRLCKGIYKESPEIAMHDGEKINENYILLVKTLLRGQGYACIATHDLELINQIEKFIEENEISPNRFEFQVLFGVPMGNKLEHLKEKGYKVRIYVPFGEAWFDYSIRRLKENPKIISYIIGNIFKK